MSVMGLWYFFVIRHSTLISAHVPYSNKPEWPVIHWRGLLQADPFSYVVSFVSGVKDSHSAFFLVRTNINGINRNGSSAKYSSSLFWKRIMKAAIQVAIPR